MSRSVVSAFARKDVSFPAVKVCAFRVLPILFKVRHRAFAGPYNVPKKKEEKRRSVEHARRGT